MSVDVNLLKQLGMEEKEAKVYLAALEFGPTTVVKLAKKSGIKRTTIYEFIEDMVGRGLIVSTISVKRKLYSASEPAKLEQLVEKQKEIIKEILPGLESLAKKSPQRPKVRFYEGIEGLKAVYNDTLDQPAGSEILGYAVFGSAYETLPETFLNGYIKRRVKKRISARGLMPSDEYIEIHAKENKEELRETIILPKKDFPVSNEINIYQNKVAIMSFGDEKIGIIIESQQIADTQRAIFNLLWKSLKSKNQGNNKSKNQKTEKADGKSS